MIDEDDTDAIMEAAVAQGRDLVLPTEIIVNGIRLDPGLYRVRLDRVGWLPAPDMDDHPF